MLNLRGININGRLIVSGGGKTSICSSAGGVRVF